MTFTRTQKGYVALVIVSLFWGTSYTASKIGNAYMPALFIAAVRQLFTGIIITVAFFCSGNCFPSKVEMKKVFVQAGLLLFIGNGLITWSMEYISSGLAAIVAALTPMTVAIFSLRSNSSNKRYLRVFAGLGVGLVGVCVIFYDHVEFSGSLPFLIGSSMAAFSVVSWALGSVYTSTHSMTLNVLFNVGLQMLFSGIMLLIVCFVSGKYVNLLRSPVEGWYSLLYLIIIGSLLSYTSYLYALQRLPPTVVSIYAYVNPVVAILLGWLLLEEEMNIHFLEGVFLILFSIYLSNRQLENDKSPSSKKLMTGR